MRLPSTKVAVPAVLAVAAAAVLSIAALTVTGGSSDHGSVGAGGARTTKVERSVYRPPSLWLPTADAHGVLPSDRHVTIMVSSGTLSSVRVTDSRGRPLPGTTGSDGRLWTSAANPIPLERYSARVGITDARGDTATQTRTFTAGDSAKHLIATLSPGDGDTVGIGQPVVVTFNRWVPESLRRAVQQRLEVTTSPAVTGGWRWFNGQELHWRPRQFWAPGTTVTVRSDLAYLHYGDGIWGQREAHTTTFRIGPAHVSKVDATAHTMDVYSSGQLVRHFNISAGSPKYPSMSGTLLALSKSPDVVMDSETVGIPRDSPDGYYEHVAWDVRLTNGGAFVHAAPWSVAEQGVRNVSHGCVNLAPADAKWFYDFSRRGDVVQIVNTGRPPDVGDEGAFDWNTAWSEWAS